MEHERPVASERPVLIGIAGLGGWAAACGDQLLRAASASGGAIRFAAACDPLLDAHAARAHELRQVGVSVADSFERMLEQPLDAVWLPVPIALHRPFAAQALAAGRAVLVEKPAAGIVQDVDAMIADRDRAGLPVAVAFQTMYDDATWQAKRLLLEGAVGHVRRASVVGCWPRGASYYARNRWAGRLRDGDAWVLDSPANNAMAHFLNLALFLLGPTADAPAAPALVEAELYRANPIETYDTCTLRVTLLGGAALLVAMTHACAGTVDPVVTIEGGRGLASIRP